MCWWLDVTEQTSLCDSNHLSLLLDTTRLAICQWLHEVWMYEYMGPWPLHTRKVNNSHKRSWGFLFCCWAAWHKKYCKYVKLNNGPQAMGAPSGSLSPAAVYLPEGLFCFLFFWGKKHRVTEHRKFDTYDHHAAIFQGSWCLIVRCKILPHFHFLPVFLFCFPVCCLFVCLFGEHQWNVSMTYLM